MSTIQCTVPEFNAQVAKFMKVSGSKSYSQDEVAAAHKCMTLHYFGADFPDQQSLEQGAMFLEVATIGAIRRGWQL